MFKIRACTICSVACGDRSSLCRSSGARSVSKTQHTGSWELCWISAGITYMTSTPDMIDGIFDAQSLPLDNRLCGLPATRGRWHPNPGSLPCSARPARYLPTLSLSLRALGGLIPYTLVTFSCNMSSSCGTTQSTSRLLLSSRMNSFHCRSFRSAGRTGRDYLTSPRAVSRTTSSTTARCQ